MQEGQSWVRSRRLPGVTCGRKHRSLNMPVARGEGQAGSLGVPGGRLGRASALGRLPLAVCPAPTLARALRAVCCAPCFPACAPPEGRAGTGLGGVMRCPKGTWPLRCLCPRRDNCPGVTPGPGASGPALPGRGLRGVGLSPLDLTGWPCPFSTSLSCPCRPPSNSSWWRT